MQAGTSAVATIEITAGDDGVAVDTVNGADLILDYDTSGPAAYDWTDAGSADRLRIAIAEMSHPLTISLTVTSFAGVFAFRIVRIDAPTAGVYEVPFANFGFEAPDAFAQVNSFSLVALQLLAAPGRSSFAVSDLRTVPEPDAAIVAVIATLALLAATAGRRLRSRDRRGRADRAVGRQSSVR